MPGHSERRDRWLISAVAVVLSTGVAWAQSADTLRSTPIPNNTFTTNLALMSLSLQAEETTAEQTDVTITEESASPLRLGLTYSLYSDYVWRGINLSEYAGEGREKPNHQLDVALDLDIGLLVGEEAGTCGVFTFGTWFEWFAAQEKLDPVSGGQNNQEIDYYLTWAHDIESIATKFSLGYIFWTYPNAKTANTQEWWFSLEHNDAWLWKGLWPDNEDGVLNPSFTLYHDVALGTGSAVWMEIGLSHEFEVAEDLTVTPSWTLGIDHNFHHYIAGDPHGHTTRFANMLWGLDVTYDITELLNMTPSCGSLAVSGFLYFSDALGNAEDSGVIQDEFFGGMSVGWSF